MAKTIFRRKKRRNPLPIILACVAAAALAVGVIVFTLAGQGDTPPSSAGDPATVTPQTTRRTLPKSFIDNNTFSPTSFCTTSPAVKCCTAKMPTLSAIPPV